MSTYKTKFHRDGTITLWNIFAQAWQRLQADLIADSVLATLSDSERARIAKIASRFE